MSAAEPRHDVRARVDAEISHLRADPLQRGEPETGSAPDVQNGADRTPEQRLRRRNGEPGFPTRGLCVSDSRRRVAIPPAKVFAIVLFHLLGGREGVKLAVIDHPPYCARVDIRSRPADPTVEELA